jgi:osmotically inducible protein OsmC
MAAESRATAHWSGSLFEGSGNIEVDSGATGNLPITWEGRAERPPGSTSPEELIAAAHAACLSMALSNGLAQAGTPAQSLDVKATGSFEKTDGGFRITKMHLDVTGRVPGMEAADFEQAVAGAKDGCPVSNALKNNVDISVSASLS